MVAVDLTYTCMYVQKSFPTATPASQLFNTPYVAPYLGIFLQSPKAHSNEFIGLILQQIE